MYYHLNLILITILFYIISIICKKYYISFLQIFVVFMYIIQFSDFNYNFFNLFSADIQFSIGYFVETMPLAITGLSISYFDIINKLKKFIFMTFFYSFSLLFIFFKYDIFSPVKGFGKQGIMYNIGALSIFFIFSLIPLDNLNKKEIIFFKYLTSYTPGIYFLHLKINEIFGYKISSIKNHTFLGCLYIYILCYLISFIGFLLLKKTKLKNIFV